MPRITPHIDSKIPERKRIVNADIFVSEAAISEMLDHADRGASENAEVMGLLAGRMYRDENGVYAEADKAVTAKLHADEVSVRFDHSDMTPLFDALDDLDFEYVIVGWYHSHIGIGCFMSETDIRTHSSVFGGSGFAVVIDPIKEELKVFKGSENGPEEASMVVMESHTQMA
ncbi:MAG: Mov34/MPN/PAD-1 family protein [Methanomassiliicoccaceae archaeon]|nr:Mov34/MPN/PAD-1 family protein [Methanomassiliicoccaceae archaeon]